MPTVIKADGSQEPFNAEKVLVSIRRAGVPESLQGPLLTHIKEKAYDGIQTWEIFQHINEYLAKSSHPYCRAKYSLKQAVMMLGPTGYPFEDFVANILSAHGYQTEVRQQIQGRCVSHEIDVIAKKDGKTAMIEAKFHNNSGIRSDLHVALYTKARFEDVAPKNQYNEGWLVTNTKVTTDAIAFATCSGLKIISWGYPEGESLRDLIESAKLHPITMLSTLTTGQKVQLLANHIVLCKDICMNHALIDKLPLSKEERKAVLDEISYICKEERSA